MLLALRLHNGFVWWVIEAEILESELWSWIFTGSKSNISSAIFLEMSMCFLPAIKARLLPRTCAGPRSSVRFPKVRNFAHCCGLNPLALHALSCFEYLVGLYSASGRLVWPFEFSRSEFWTNYFIVPTQCSPARCLATDSFPEFNTCAIKQPWCYFG